MMPTTGCIFRRQGLRNAANLSAITLLALAGCGGTGYSLSSPPPTSEASAGNAPPTISGQASVSAVAGRTYSFTPLATDSNGDPLTFAISNLPSWAAFDVSTGRLSGTPTGNHVGTYSNITIGVSDGHTSVTLTPFSIRVNAVSNGTALVSWIPPTQRTDGSPLGNLAGFRIYFGEESDLLTEVISVPNAGLTSFLVENLPVGTWHFTVTAVDEAGVESSQSNSATKTIG